MKEYNIYETLKLKVIEVEQGFATSLDSEGNPGGSGENFPWG